MCQIVFWFTERRRTKCILFLSNLQVFLYSMYSHIYRHWHKFVYSVVLTAIKRFVTVSVGRSKRQCAKMFCFACVRMYWRIFLDFYCRCSILFFGQVCVCRCVGVCDFKEKKRSFNASIVQTEKDVWFHFIPHTTGTNINVKYNELNKKNKQHTSQTLAKKQFLHVLRFLFPPETSDVTAQHSLIQLFFAVLRLLHTFVHIFFLFLVGCFGAQSKSLFILLFVNRRYDNQKTVDHIEYFGCLSHILPSIPFIWWWCAQKTNSTFATIWNYQYDVFPQFVLKKFPFVQWFGVLVFV